MAKPKVAEYPSRVCSIGKDIKNLVDKDRKVRNLRQAEHIAKKVFGQDENQLKKMR